MLKIGLLFSLTGTTSITEKGQYQMAEFAIQQYRQTYGEVEVIVRDIESDPIKTAEEAESLAKQGVKIMIGCYTSACRKAILPILEKYQCMLVYPTLYEGKECHANVFYTGEVPNQQVYVLLDYLTRHFGRRVYCVGTDYVYPRETNQQVKNYLKEKDGTMIREVYTPFGHQQFYDILQDILDQRADAIFLTLVGTSIAPFYQAYHELGLDPDKLPIFSPITKETEIAAMGAHYAANHYSSASYFQALNQKDNQLLVEQFHHFTEDKEPISSVMFNTYLGTRLILETAHLTNSTDYRELFYELSGKEMETACGRVKVAKNHRHLSRPCRVGKGRMDGQFDIVWSSSHNISPNPFIEKVPEDEEIQTETLKLLGKISQDPILVLSSSKQILYISEEATALTKWKKDMSLTAKQLLSLQFSFHVETIANNDQEILLLHEKEKEQLPSRNVFQFGPIQTVNDHYKRELEVARLASQSTANTLILGETGTGKEVMANAIHQMSDRKHGPFIAVNSGLIPKELIASELFGYTDGAYTGAKKGGSIGKFEAADGGTLFLDEIGDMPLDLQVILLRAVETGKVTRLGENKERKVDIRIIAATNRNLQEEIAYHKGSFRSDLYYRLNVLSITIPPLRERMDDIGFLIHDFLQHFEKVHRKGPATINRETLRALTDYQWPGNVRELRNVMERAYLLSREKGEEILPTHLPAELFSPSIRKSKPKNSIKSAEKQLIEEALQRSSSVRQASEQLGIARSTLYRKIKEYELN